MNLKQKLTYMLIGSLFTLAGYFLATLANNQPPNAHAQDNATKVFEKIVCKEIEVVNNTGKKLLRMGEAAGGSGFIIVYNKEEIRVVGMDGIDNEGGTIAIANKRGKMIAKMGENLLFGGGQFEIKNDVGKNGIVMNSFLGGVITVFDCTKEARRVSIWGKADVGGAGMVAVYGDNQMNPVVVLRKSITNTGGIITVANTRNKINTQIGSGADGRGYVEVYNKEGKALVFIGAEDTSSNDGLINIYDFKGRHRSYTAD